MRSGKVRLSANAWTLLIAFGVLSVIGGELVRATIQEAARERLRGAVTGTEAPNLASDPAFRVGDVAPDFTLPDRTGRRQRLSAMVRSNTILCFICGCASCEDLQTYLGLLLKKMGAKAPRVVSVSTMPRDSEASWLRRTRLSQSLLYEAKDGPVMTQYRGHPCPRIYRVDKSRRVTWIGPSLREVPSMRTMGLSMAGGLGFSAREARAVGQNLSPTPPQPDAGSLPEEGPKRMDTAK